MDHLYKSGMISILLIGLSTAAAAHQQVYRHNVIFIDPEPRLYHPGYRYGERVYLRRHHRQMNQYYYVTPDQLAPMPRH